MYQVVSALRVTDGGQRQDRISAQVEKAVAGRMGESPSFFMSKEIFLTGWQNSEDRGWKVSILEARQGGST